MLGATRQAWAVSYLSAFSLLGRKNGHSETQTRNGNFRSNVGYSRAICTLSKAAASRLSAYLRPTYASRRSARRVAREVRTRPL